MNACGETPIVFTASDLADGGKVFRKLDPPARLAVFGDPVAHSASPPMHNAALQARGLKLQYIRIRVTPEELPQALRNLTTAGFLGASLTIPHKQAALPIMDEVSLESRLMGAVNTVQVVDGKLHGHNTDGPGLSAAIREEFGIPLKELRVLILGGAGGAGRAITVQCALEGCPGITVANRNHQKGDALAAEIRDTLGKEINSISLDPDEIGNQLATTDLIINATPLGMNPDDPSPLRDNLLEPRHLVYDTVYSGGETALLRQVHAVGARGANGFSMLLHQGVIQNALWFGEPVPVDAMRGALASLRR
ncbi:MAG: Quinate/shikimate dehydrogenase [Verrucomicrobiota bacterium]|jgi:shikimate dehydrogenase